MSSVHGSALILEVTQEVDGGYVAECLTDGIVTQGDPRDERQGNLKDAVEGYFPGGPKPRSLRLRLLRDEVLMIE